jgi:hypothetical protein
MVTGGIHSLALLLLIVAWLCHAVFAASLGLYFSVASSSKVQATLRALLVLFALQVGSILAGDRTAWTTPIYSFWSLAFHPESFWTVEFEPDRFLWTQRYGPVHGPGSEFSASSPIAGGQCTCRCRRLCCRRSGGLVPGLSAVQCRERTTAWPTACCSRTC